MVEIDDYVSTGSNRGIVIGVYVSFWDAVNSLGVSKFHAEQMIRFYRPEQIASKWVAVECEDRSKVIQSMELVKKIDDIKLDDLEL